VHRIGRTGRAGAKGEALSLVCTEELGYLNDIQKLVGMKIPSETLEGFEPDPNEPKEPAKQGQGRGRNSRGGNSNSRSKGKASSNKSTNNSNRNKSGNSRRSR